MTDVLAGEPPRQFYLTDRTGGEILRDSLRIYRANFGALVAIYGLPLVPFLALSTYALATGNDGLYATMSIVTGLAMVFPYGALTLAVSNICLGNRPTPGRVYGELHRYMWSYLGTYLLYILVVLGGFVLLILPGLVAAMLFMFAPSVCVIERRGPINSMRRSRQLIRGRFWRTTGLALSLWTLLYLFALAVMLLVVGFLGQVIGVGYYDEWMVIDEILWGVTTLLLTPLMLTAFVLLYYDLRVRKENYDSNALMQELMA